MAELVYVLCLATAMGCAGVLLAAYRRGRAPLLLWAGMCFVCLAANEALVLLDLYAMPEISLILARRVAGLFAVTVMLFGLILHSQEASE